MNHPPTLNVDTADVPDRPLSPGSSIYSGRTLSPGPRKRDRFLSPFQASSRSRISLDQQDDLPVEPLTEQDLRDIFEEEEIQRFLNTFHSVSVVQFTKDYPVEADLSCSYLASWRGHPSGRSIWHGRFHLPENRHRPSGRR